ILIVLAKYLAVLDNQQTGDWNARQVVHYERANVHLRPLEDPWCRRPLDPVRRTNFIKMTVSADAILPLMRLAGLNTERGIGDRKSLRCTIKLGVRTRRREDRAGGLFSGRIRRLAKGGACGAGGKTSERCTTGNNAAGLDGHSTASFLRSTRAATGSPRLSRIPDPG